MAREVVGFSIVAAVGLGWFASTLPNAKLPDALFGIILLAPCFGVPLWLIYRFGRFVLNRDRRTSYVEHRHTSRGFSVGVGFRKD